MRRYDFGYLLKLLTCQALPASEEAFFHLLHRYFPCTYDIKHVMNSKDGLRWKGGLNKLASNCATQQRACMVIRIGVGAGRDPRGMRAPPERSTCQAGGRACGW